MRGSDTRDFNDENCSVKVPTVTVNTIQRAAKAGLRPRLFLDEIDKARLNSEARVTRVFEIIDEVYQHGGQLVAVSNKSPEEMTRLKGWDKDWTQALLSRFTRENDAHTVEFGRGLDGA